MLDTLLSGAYAPFTFAIALLFGLLILELAFALLGGTLLGAGGADADIDMDVDFDIGDLGDMAEVGVDLDGLDMDPSEFELPSPEDIAGEIDGAPEAAPGIAAWLGLGKVPGLIWLAVFLLAFGMGGIVLQNIAGAIIAPLPLYLAIPPVVIAALWFARGFGTVFARLLPKTETQSVAQSSLGRRTGVVTQGTAKRGTPAEVRVTDRFGNSHYLRAEPMQDHDEIVQGAEVLVLRHRPTGGFRLLQISDEPQSI